MKTDDQYTKAGARYVREKAKEWSCTPEEAVVRLVNWWAIKEKEWQTLYEKENKRRYVRYLPPVGAYSLSTSSGE